MSVDRNELHELVEQLPDDQVPFAVADLRRRAETPRRSTRPFAWIGAGETKDNATDVSTNPDYLRGFGRDSL